MRWNTDATAPFWCLDFLERVVLVNCPQASLRVYEPEYLGPFSTKAINDEGSNLLSVLMTWFDESEGSDEALCLDTQQKLIRPILFIAHGLGGLIVEKVCDVSLYAIRLAEYAQALLQAKSQEKAHSVATRTFGIVRLALSRIISEKGLVNCYCRYSSALHTPVTWSLGAIQHGRKPPNSASMTDDGQSSPVILAEVLPRLPATSCRCSRLCIQSCISAKMTASNALGLV